MKAEASSTRVGSILRVQPNPTMADLRASGKGFAVVNQVAAVASQDSTIVGPDRFYDKFE